MELEPCLPCGGSNHNREAVLNLRVTLNGLTHTCCCACGLWTCHLRNKFGTVWVSFSTFDTGIQFQLYYLETDGWMGLPLT